MKKDEVRTDLVRITLVRKGVKEVRRLRVTSSLSARTDQTEPITWLYTVPMEAEEGEDGTNDTDF